MNREMFDSRLFKDRADAGRQLAEKLIKYEEPDTVVLALPRGGVVVAYEVAKQLNASLDVIVARKLGEPSNPEYGFGAIAEGGVVVLDEAAIEFLGLTKKQIEEIVAVQTEELQRRVAAYRGSRPSLKLLGKTVILVDDGLATGVTARAAVQAIKLFKPNRLILAVPVAALDSAQALRTKVDELVCLHERTDLSAVGQWYENFDQVTDEEVVAILEKARK